MGRQAKSLQAIQGGKGKHLTKKEIAHRKAAEERLRLASDRIECPAWLDDDGRAEWERVIELKESGLLLNVDVTNLAIYCDAVSGFLRERAVVMSQGPVAEYTNKAGATNETLSAHFLAMLRYWQVIDRYSEKFGLTPSARVRLTLPPRAEEKDPFEATFGV